MPDIVPLNLPLTPDQVQHLIDAVTAAGQQRRRDFGLEQAHNITFMAGAATVFLALGIGDKVPMAWHLAFLRQSDPFTGEMYPDGEGNPG